MNHIAVLTSGGDAPGMNAATRSVVRTGIQHGLTVTGVKHGYCGLIEDTMTPLNWRDVSHIISKGGTILRTARAPDFLTEQGRTKARDNLIARGINGLVVIGGNGSLAGADLLAKEYPELRVVGLPSTIDNDISGTDATIGYDTAINTAMEAIDKISDTALAHDRVFVVEVMGRQCGDIALQTGIATGAEAVLVPEQALNIDDLAALLLQHHSKKTSSSIVIVAEGNASGGAMAIANQLRQRHSDIEYRVTILGHLQRGGSPTCRDRVLASKLGIAAVDALLKGENRVMLGTINNVIAATPLQQAIQPRQHNGQDLLEVVNLLN